MKLQPSDPRYPRVNDLWNSYAQVKNVQVWYNLKEMPLEFQLKAQEEIEAQMKLLLMNP